MELQRKDYKKNTYIIMLMGAILRLIYVLGTTVFERQYDIGTIALEAGHTVSGGHLAYIQYLYENLHLPDFDPTQVYQFNHPPLHHYLSMLVLKLFTPFIKDYSQLYETMQLIPFISSLFILWFSYLIMKKVVSDERGVQLGMTVLAFHPALILLSGSVNNDTLGLLFTLLCVYTTMRWCEKKTYVNIIWMALSIGLGMMTKQNVALMAFPMATVFGYELLCVMRQQKKAVVSGGQIGMQYLLFGVISIPLGMWFYVRNLILYKMPLVWVYTLSEDTWQYTGNVPILHRFLWPNPVEFLDNLKHFTIGCGYNVWIQIMRTSVLGEWDMADVGKGVKALAMLLMLVGFLLAIFSFICFITVMIQPKKYVLPITTRILFVVSYVVVFASYLKFAYDYPQQCSMHFRYIEIELLFTVLGMGMWYTQNEKKGRAVLLQASIILFCVLSLAMTFVWSVVV